MTDDYVPEHAAESKPLMSDALYEKLRFLAVILLPALGALYFGVAQIWGLPKAEEVVGTLVVVDTFLGALLGFARQKYENSDVGYDGHIYLSEGETPDSKTAGLNVTTPASELEGKRTARLKVHKKE
jgi:hypothetical protein